MYIITLILGIVGVVLLAFAIREDEDDRAFPLGILSVVSLICSVMLWCYTDTKYEREQPLTTISTFVEEHSQYLSPTTVRTVSAAPIREMPDGCFVYSVILVDQDSMYTYSAVLDPNPCKVQAVIDVNFDGRRTDAIRQTAAFANYVKQVEQVMSETHE